jgi:hypothetical protein
MRGPSRSSAQPAPGSRRRVLHRAAPFALLAALAAHAQATASPIPVVHGFTPASGPAGTIVKIAGENFDQVLWIEFAGGVRCDFRLFSSSMLKVEVPEGAGSGPILLHAEQGGAWTPSAFHVVSPPSGGLELAAPAPSPGAPPFRLRFGLPDARRVRLDVMDVRGRRVRRLLDQVLERGPHETAWDGRDAAGLRAGPGLYLVMLRLEEGIVTRRLIAID